MSISKQIITTFFTKIVSFPLSFITGIIFLRMLGSEGNGIQTFILSNVGLLTTFLCFNILQTLIYFNAKQGFDKKAGNGFALLISMLSIFIFSITVLIIYATNSNIIDYMLPDQYQTGFFLFFFIFSFINQVSSQYITGFLQGNQKFELINKLTLAQNIISAAIIIPIWFYVEYLKIDLSIERLLLISIIVSSILLSIRIIVLLFINYTISSNIQNVAFKMLRYSLVGWGTLLINFAVKRIDIWFIEYYHNLSLLGSYALAARLTDLVIMLFGYSSYVIAPHITKANSVDQKLNILCLFNRVSFSLLIPISIFLIVLSYFFIPLLYGEDFRNSIIPFQILVIGMSSLVIRNIFGIYNMATNNLNSNLYGILLSFIATVLLDIILIPKYGIIGASIASIFTYFVSTYFIVYQVVSTNNLPISEYFVLKKTDLIKIKKEFVKLLSKYEAKFH